MKVYTVTVNGTAYEVTVEEGKSTSVNNSNVTTKSPIVPVQTTKSTESSVQNSQGSVKINAPLPGKILEIKNSVGDSVSKGDVIIVLEAMKMENNVIASEDGVIASINVEKGQNVEVGTVLATLN